MVLPVGQLRERLQGWTQALHSKGEVETSSWSNGTCREQYTAVRVGARHSKCIWGTGDEAPHTKDCGPGGDSWDPQL